MTLSVDTPPPPLATPYPSPLPGFGTPPVLLNSGPPPLPAWRPTSQGPCGTRESMLLLPSQAGIVSRPSTPC